MTGTLGREVEDAYAEARALFLTDLMPDSYEIERTVLVKDGYGGETEQPGIVEMGPCKLATTARLSSEGLSGSVVMAVSSYTVKLPMTTTLTETDVLIVNGRRFDVVSPPKQAGVWGITVTADLEERR